MDDETRTAVAGIAETMNAGFARMDARMEAGFALVDRYIELQQTQFQEFRAEVRADLADIKAQLDLLTKRVDRLEAEVGALRQELNSLRQEFRAFRDWATREITDLRRGVRTLQNTTDEAQAAVRRELDHLKDRIDRVEERLDDVRRR